MITPEDCKDAYNELGNIYASYPNEKHKLPNKSKLLNDRSEIIIIPALYGDQPGFLAGVSASEALISASITEKGLLSFSVNTESVSVKLPGNPYPQNNLRLHYEDIDPDGVENDRILYAARPFITWLEKLDSENYFSPAPITIRQRLNYFAANRRFERFMRIANPHFDVNSHIL